MATPIGDAVELELGGGSGRMTVFLAILRRDLRLGLRRIGEAAQPLVFFILALALFPLGVGQARKSSSGSASA